MPRPAACTSPRPRSASASRPSRSSSAGWCWCARSRCARPKPAPPIVRLARQVALLEHDALAELGADDEEGAIVSVALAVNADSLATWFLEPLARLGMRHPVVFELHRDDQDFTAGLLESGTVMGAVTSRAAPVAGLPREPARDDALRSGRHPRVRRSLDARRGDVADALERAPLVDFDRRDDLQTRWLAERDVAADAPPRHFVPASHDFATAVKLGFGWGLLPGFQSDAELRRRATRAARRHADRRAPLLAAVEPALPAARRDRRRDRRRGPAGARTASGEAPERPVSRR